MAAWIQALILGIVQGLTEFLPVSSSGHLVLAQALLGEDFEFRHMAVAFDVALHVGTLLPVLYFYRRDLAGIVIGFTEPPKVSPRALWAWLTQNEGRRLALLVFIGTLPTAVIGILLKDVFEGLFHNPKAVSLALAATGVLLLSTRGRGQDAQPGRERLNVATALAIGLVQGLAITPGVSRSGSTIAVALLLGLSRDQAARFSFLLSIPAILGATLMVAKDGVTIPDGSTGALFVGFLASVTVGYLALVLLVALVRRGGLHNFAIYLFPLAALGWFFSSTP